MYCDDCVQERLGLKWRQQVQVITATLAVTGSFDRRMGICCVCHKSKQVIQATGAGRESAAASFAEEPRSAAGMS